jgi:hypothetical protein
MESSNVSHDDRWQARYHDIPRLVDSAVEKYRRSQSEQSRPERETGPEPPPNFEQQTRQHQRFTGKILEAITMITAPNYLVKGVLPRQGLGVVWGPPKCGKSFWTFDLVMHVALGRDYRGHTIQQGTVIYLVLEGQGGFPRRIEAYRQRHLNGERGQGVPFYLIDESINLIADAPALIAALRRQLTTAPAIIVCDTLNRAMVGDENDSEDMAKLIRAAASLQTAFGCLVLLIHHCGVAGNRPRGHTSLSGADDVQIAIERGKDGIVRAKIEHAKDGQDGTVFACKLEPVEVGRDTDGDPITSCVIVPSEAGAAGPKLNKTQRFALEVLKKLIASKEDSVEVLTDNPLAKKGIPIGTRVCRNEDWRKQFYETYPAEKVDAKRKALLRATLDLEEQGLIELLGEYVCLRDKQDKPSS